MSRIRSTHPGIWTDERFVGVSAYARLLFMGIWNECDDYGSFEWSPLKLKMRLLPADNVDAAELLAELEAAGSIMRYEVGGKPFGAVRNFCQYQRPKKPTHVHPQTEAVEAWVNIDARSTRDGSEGVGEELPTSGEKSRQRKDEGGRRRPDSAKAKSGEARKRARTTEFEIPDWVPAEPIAAFLAMRAKKKKPVDDYMAKQLFGRLKSIADAGWNLEDVINKATVNFHDGFWMPDGRDPSIRKATVQPLSEEERKARDLKNAEFFEGIGRHDEAEEVRRRWATVPSGTPIGDIAQRFQHQGAPS